MNKPYEFDSEKFAKILKNARKKTEYTIEEIMDETGISSPTTVKCYENGVSMPRADNFIMLCLIYGLSLEDFDDCVSMPK